MNENGHDYKQEVLQFDNKNDSWKLQYKVEDGEIEYRKVNIYSIWDDETHQWTPSFFETGRGVLNYYYYRNNQKNTWKEEDFWRNTPQIRIDTQNALNLDIELDYSSIIEENRTKKEQSVRE